VAYNVRGKGLISAYIKDYRTQNLYLEFLLGASCFLLEVSRAFLRFQEFLVDVCPRLELGIEITMANFRQNKK